MVLCGNLCYSDLIDDFGYVYLYDYKDWFGIEVDCYYFGIDSVVDELIGNVML